MSEIDTAPHKFSISHRFTLFLISAATLVFEINLTRLFSVTEFYHFAFMIVSLALLGFGASGSVLTLFPNMKNHLEKRLQTIAFGTWVSILGAYLIINWVPFDSYRMTWDLRQVVFLSIHYLALAAPFFFSGMAVGLMISTFSKNAGEVYAVNLIGSASGCIIALFAPALIGGEGTVILSCCIAGFSSLIPRRKSSHRIKQTIITTLSCVMIFLCVIELTARTKNTSLTTYFDLQLSPYKSLSYAMQYPDADSVSQTWNAYSRIDVVSSPGIHSLPGVSFLYPNPPPQEYGLFVDGDNLNPIVADDSDLSFTGFMPIAVTFKLRTDAKTLILEPRGGLDVLIALNEGASQITAVEANDLITFEASHIYNNPMVEVINEIDRSYLQQSTETFDVVIFSLTDTYHPVSSGAYSLSEVYRYTKESFHDSMDRLTPNGMLVVTRWLQMPPSEWLRVFILAVTTLEERGLDPGQRIVGFRNFNTGVLLIKIQPFTEEELSTVRSFAKDRAFDVVYLPDISPEEVNKFAILEEPLYYQAFTNYLNAESAEEWWKNYPYDISPPTDDHPFYGHYFKWTQMRQIIEELGKTWQPFGGAGYLVVLIMLSIAFLLALILILLPLVISRIFSSNFDISRLPRRTVLASVAYFVLIGLGFLFVEIPLIQHFILFLGQPTYSISTVLFSILFFSGIGSQISDKIKHRVAIIGLTGLVFLYLWMLPIIMESSLGLPLQLRVCAAILILAPLGILMGIPFPKGIRKLEITAPKLIPWVWGINGATSVVASILAMLLALSFGFRLVLIVGGLCYAGAWLVTPLLGLIRFRR